jgi:hypothetical protein
MNSDIVWDNGMYYTTAIPSQWDKQYPFEAWVADDFLFENATYIDGVSWIGGYGGYKVGCHDGPFDMQITFYLDRGDGCAPGTVVTGPIFFYNSQTHETDLGEHWYSYNVTLPESILFEKNQIYWISIQAVGVFPPEWFIGVHTGTIIMHETVWKCDLFGVYDWEDVYEQYGEHYNMCFQLLEYTAPPPPPKPDLDCNGQLSWTDIKPRVRVTGSFQVMNIGNPNSHLNWTIASYPDWGTWTFTPSAGMNLAPEDGAITVNVTVIAPNGKNQAFQGNITVVNKDNSSDYRTIPVILTTPLHQNIEHHGFLERLLERFPNAFPILHYFLERVLMKS